MCVSVCVGWRSANNEAEKELKVRKGSHAHTFALGLPGRKRNIFVFWARRMGCTRKQAK